MKKPIAANTVALCVCFVAFVAIAGTTSLTVASVANAEVSMSSDEPSDSGVSSEDLADEGVVTTEESSTDECGASSEFSRC